MFRNSVQFLSIIIVSVLLHASFAISEVRFLSSQDWSDDDRDFFYYTTQGSQIMPYTWFRVLEQADNEKLFTENGMQRFGFIPGSRSKRNIDGLPIGFAIDRDSKGYFVGLTCAACHTSQVKKDDMTIRIDGGAGHIDFTLFITELDKSFRATLNSDEKFARFYNRVKRVERDTRESSLKKKLLSFADKWSEYVANSEVSVKWGPARNDAFGMIFNRATAIDLELPDNNRPPNAPVSYPFLWGASHHSVVQWNGIAKNKTFLDRLGRNVGEVLGVFGATDLKKARTFRPYYRTSVRRINLASLEHKIRDLKAPAWPTELGVVDPLSWNAGKQLFNDNCASCHEIVPGNDQFKKIDVVMTPISELGTDITMAQNACERTSLTGRLEGSKLPLQPSLPAEMPSAALLANLVGGAILYPNVKNEFLNRSIFSRSRSEFADQLSPQSLTLGLHDETTVKDTADFRIQAVDDFLQKQAVPDVCNENDPLMRYKARPLNGVWATAPFLHNGSVPTLADLLLPAEKRPKTFGLDFTDFDTDKVGFGTDTGNPNVFVFDTTLPGNSNAGHDTYGERNFTDEQRKQLVDYLKTL